MTAKPKKSTARVLKLREDNRRRGRVRKEYYVTPAEHEALKRALEGMRE